VKVKAALERRHSGWLWPAASTIGELFAREGLTARRKRRRRTPPGGPLFAADAPNDVWAVDFKGWFRTGDGARCDTLTLADACSRYLLRCQAVAHPDTGHVWPILDAAFREHGAAVASAFRQRPPVRDGRRRRALPARGHGDQGRSAARAPPASRRRTAGSSGCT